MFKLSLFQIASRKVFHLRLRTASNRPAIPDTPINIHCDLLGIKLYLMMVRNMTFLLLLEEEVWHFENVHK